MRKAVKAARLWVIKVGSSLLTANDDRLDLEFVRALAGEIALLRRDGRAVILVSSGAVAAGMRRLGWTKRPRALADLQVAAAVGQVGLVDAYEAAFAEHQTHAAQVLLTAEDMTSRTLYLNARSALKRLLALGIVPVVNENDAIAAAEMRFGDNDRLAALLANLVEADLLVMLTDAAGVYRDPANPGDVIGEISVVDSSLKKLAASTSSSGVGVGGMASKVSAAIAAARSGAHSVIVGGRAPSVLAAVADGKNIGTLLVADLPRIGARKRWLASGLTARGNLALDDGAVKAICERGKSLLPAGIIAVKGRFRRGDAVAMSAGDGGVVAHGLVNYGADEVGRLMGCPSREIENLLGYMNEEEIVHRDNLAVLRAPMQNEKAAV